MSVDVTMHRPKAVVFTHGENFEVGWIDFQDEDGVEVTIFMDEKAETLSIITQLRAITDELAEWNSKRQTKIEPAGVGKNGTPTDEE